MALEVASKLLPDESKVKTKDLVQLARHASELVGMQRRVIRLQASQSPTPGEPDATGAAAMTVCTGPTIDGVIMPANGDEYGLANRHAVRVRDQIINEAERKGISRTDMLDAISRATRASTGCPLSRA